MNVTFVTLGCKVNQYESQAMLAAMEAAGFTACPAGQPCDVAVVNSCTVTSASDHKVRQTLARVRREHPDAVVVLTGCMPQAFPERAELLTDADVVLGNSNRAALVPDVLKYLSSRQRIIDIAPHDTGFEDMKVERFFERTRAFVKIEDGCNRFCSYCIIPYARGRVRSKPLEALKAELASLGKNGYQEVVLTGINLSAYGQDFGLHLCDAVEAACAVEGIKRVRLGSLEPEQLEPAVIERLAKQPKLCPQFHLSLQSGCDETLTRMNRHYTADEYRKIVANLRRAFPNAAMTTDVMVGFPGETNQEFQESLAFVKEIAFAKAHVFAYSRRPGTVADKATGQIFKSVKESRSREMILAAQETQTAFFNQQLGRTEAVLFEQSVAPGVYEGYTANYTPVRAASGANPCGQILPVLLTGAEPEYCLGKIVKNS